MWRTDLAHVKMAEPWSLFNPAVHGSHFSALRQLLQQADRIPRLPAATSNSVAESGATQINRWQNWRFGDSREIGCAQSADH
jgi:hypothetical protein